MVTFQLYCLLPLRDRKILEKDLEALVFMYCELAQKRYVSQRSQRRRPTNKFAIDLMHTNIINPEVPWLNEIEFLNGYRMTKLAFARLVRAIENHPCFRNIRGPLQQPVAYQVMVLLHYLGSAGSGASSHRARNHFLSATALSRTTGDGLLQQLESTYDLYTTAGLMPTREPKFQVKFSRNSSCQIVLGQLTEQHSS